MGVYISGVGLTRFGKSSVSIEELMAEAALMALRNADRDRVDALFVAVADVAERMEDFHLISILSDHLGDRSFLSTPIHAAPFPQNDFLETAIKGLGTGRFKRILILTGGRMTHLPGVRMNQYFSEWIDRTERRYGINPVALAALVAQRYRKEYRLTLQQLEDTLSSVSVKNHCNGSLNGLTPFRQEMTREDYFKSRIVSHPLRLLDCSPLTDGASAVLLTSEPAEIRLSGIGFGTDTSAFRHRASLTSFKATREAAVKAYGMAQRNPSEIQFAEVHDAFTPLEVIGTEDLGFFRPGEGWRALQEGTTQLKGRLPINPSGGLKSRGHPVEASLLAQVVEIVWQLQGQAENERQLKEVGIGLAESKEGMGNRSMVAVLEREDRKKVWIKGWQPDYRPAIESNPEEEVLPPVEGLGTLESFTVLYAPPDGFRSPLALGLVQSEEGKKVVACNPVYRSPGELRMGQKVHLSMREGLYVFEKKRFWDRLKDRWRKWKG